MFLHKYKDPVTGRDLFVSPYFVKMLLPGIFVSSEVMRFSARFAPSIASLFNLLSSDSSPVDSIAS